MCAPSAPAPPDPKETSAASTSTNVGTAVANANLGNVNQVTPDGSLNYTQSGTYKWNDPYTGKTYDIPQYTATQTLSPEQQAIKTQSDASKLNLSTLANDQSGFLKDYMSKPFDGSNDATEARLIDLGSKRLQPMLDQRRAANEADLLNRGIRPGSDNYAAAQTQEGQNENDAYNQLLLTGHGQAFSEGQATRNQPINEITALLSGSQVSQPNLINPQEPTIPTTDVAGLINTNYNQKLQAWQQDVANQNGILGGLFGLGASAIKYSDRRLKRNIRAIGSYANGLTKYAFDYVWGGSDVGLMADEVRAVRPWAVRQVCGFDAVDYERALA